MEFEFDINNIDILNGLNYIDEYRANMKDKIDLLKNKLSIDLWNEQSKEEQHKYNKLLFKLTNIIKKELIFYNYIDCVLNEVK